MAFEPEREFAWAVSDPDHPGATWTFRISPAPDGSTLTFHRRLGPGPSGLTRLIEADPEREEEIIAGRDEMHRRHMQAVVGGIKELAEAGGGS